MTNKFLNALNRVNQNIPPIWMMRQAGRYHSHYQALRKKYSFMELCKIPELAAEVTMGPIDEFDFDNAIIFSDILFPLMEMGVKIEYTDKGVFVDNHITNQNLSKIPEIGAEGLNFQRQAIEATKARLPKNKALLGFIGGIWTLFQYASGHNLNYRENEEFLNKFSKKILPLLKANIQLQLDGGADIIMIFDSSAGEVDANFYKANLAPYLIELSEAFPNKIGYYSKGTNLTYLDKILGAKFAGYGFDENTSLKQAFSSVKHGFVQGNFNNQNMLLPKNEMVKLLKSYLNDIKEMPISERAGWVCGLSHGVLKNTPEENVHEFIKTVRETFI